VRDACPRKIFVLAADYASPLLKKVADQQRGKADWEVVEIPGGHDVMVDNPQGLADVLFHAAR
jgi:hypothetical protein